MLEIKQLTRLQIIKYCAKLLEENRKLTEERDMHRDAAKDCWYEIKRLKEVYEACNLDSINKAFKIGNLEMENKKLKKENEELKEENRKIKVIIETNDLEQKDDWKHIEELEQENKKLKEEIKRLKSK